MAKSYRARKKALIDAAPPIENIQAQEGLTLVHETELDGDFDPYTEISKIDKVGRAEAAFEKTLPPSPEEIEKNKVEGIEPKTRLISKNIKINKQKPKLEIRGIASSGATEEEVRQLFRESFGIEGEEIILQVEAMVERAIKSITLSKAFFRDQDVVKRVMYASQREFKGEREWVLENPAYPDLVKWAVDKKPLVPVGNTGALTTHEMWEAEQIMLDLSTEQDNVYIQPRDVVERAIERKKGISDEQIAAVHVATLSPKRVTVIEGTAGAGKSFTMEAVKETYQECGFDVIGTALGWAAAKVLGESAKLKDENCLAIEGLVRSWVAARKSGTDPFQRPTLLIVDEAGMVGTMHMKTILEETSKSRYPVKIVLTGDSLQVVPVAAGNALEAIIEFNGTQRIDIIRRQKMASHRRAVRQLSRRQSGAAIHTFMHQECIHWCKNKDMVFNQVIQHYLSWRLENLDKKCLILALSNADVLEINFRLREAFKKLGMVSREEARLKVNNGITSFEAEFSVGDEILLRANDKNMIVYEIDHTKPLDDPNKWKPMKLGVFNRNIGKIVSLKRSKDPVGSWDIVIDLIGDSPGRVVLNSDKFKSFDLEGMPMIHNYATTIYGSQGQTVSHTFLLDNPKMDFRLSYVGASRHKDGIDIYLDETELHRRLDNIIGKRPSLKQRISLEKQGKKLEDAQVELGRYTRAEMLSAVSMTWGKHSENLTATVYERQRRLGEQKLKEVNQELAKIRPINNSDVICDYIPSNNKPWKLVDVEEILSLPTPIHEQELVRPSDVEANKDKFDVNYMPVDVNETPLPLPARSAPVSRTHKAILPKKEDKDNGFFGKAFSWFTANNNNTKTQITKNEIPEPILRQEDPRSAFEDLEGLEDIPEEKPDAVTIEILKNKIKQIINPKPTVEIPYIKNQAPIGNVIYPQRPQENTLSEWLKNEGVQDISEVNLTNEELKNKLDELLQKENTQIESIIGSDGIPDKRPYGLSFDGVPQIIGVTGGPDDDWLSQKRGDLWDVGRFGEPRILAKDPYGQVISRYKMDGTCIVGDGFPPIIVNKDGRQNGPIYIVAGAKEYLWLRETMEKKYKNEVFNMPHIIWAAKDSDLAAIGSSLRKAEKVIVVRSKSDCRQIHWAMDMQKLLKDRQKVNANISPAITEQELDYANQIKNQKRRKPKI